MPKRLLRMLSLCLAAVMLMGTFFCTGSVAALDSSPAGETGELESTTGPVPEETTEPSSEAATEPISEEPTDTEEEILPPKGRAGIGSVYKNGMIWGGDADDEFDIVTPDATIHYEKVSMYMLYNKGAYNAAYCIAPGVDFEGIYYYTKNEWTIDDAWRSLTEDQRRAIGLALLYGYPGNIPSSSTKLQKRGAQGATQIIVTELCLGFRSPVPPFELLDSRIIDLFYSDEKGNWFTDGATGSGNGTIRNLKSCYYALAQSMADHMVIPSFAARDYDFAPSYEMTPVGDGTYSVTLTDTNNILSQCIFTDTEELSYTVSGNQLTVISSSPDPVVTAEAAKNVPDQDKQTYLIWTYGEKQPMAQAAAATDDPMPLYFKLKVSTADLNIVKTTEDGKNLAGWKFGIYSDQACTQLLSGPHITDSTGTISVKGLSAGAVWVKELGNTDAAVNDRYYCSSTNPQKVTLTAGGTGTVRFENKLSLGICRIVKKTTNGGTVAGWHFTVSSSGGKILGEYVTDETGVISLSLAPGTYTVTETDGSRDYWINDPNPSRTVMVRANQTAPITFTNQWLGKAKITKTLGNPEDGSVEGWEFSVYKINADNTMELIGNYTTDTDGTILCDLEPGQYRITEVLPEGSQWQCVSGLSRDITVTAGETAAVTFTNALRPGKIIIYKVNTQGQPLKGVVFHLEWYNGSVWKSVRYSSSPVSKPGYCSTRLQNGRLTTDETGMAVYEGLHPNTQYRLTEISTLDGYQLLAEPVYIDGLPDTLTVELNVVNVRTYELPATGGKPIVFTVLPLVAAACFAGGLLLLLKRKRKQG